MRRIASPLALALLVAVAGVSCADTAKQSASSRPAPPISAPTTTTTAPPPPPTTAPCAPDASLTAAPAAPVPPDLADVLARRVADPRFAVTDYGVSVWVEGYGEIATYEPDRPLLPASNQKLLTAMGALALLGPDTSLTTTVHATGPVSGGTLGGDLVLMGGGDSTLGSGGPHSLDALAAQVRAAGIVHVAGRLVADESRYDMLRRAAGWQDWQIPAYVGPLSALMVDRNRYRSDPAFLADPALGNAQVFRAALARHGVGVGGPTEHGSTPAGSTAVASLTSAPVLQLVTDTLLRSDNMMAELLVKEVGLHARGAGSTADGLAVITDTLSRALCLSLHGVADDGSGLSRANLRSAREWRVLLQAARTQPWWPLLDSALPVAGRTGTLAGRFRGTVAEGVVHAKTGTIIGGVALSGYGTTAGGRPFVFSAIANGPASPGAQAAIDDLVATVAGYPG